MNYEIMELDDGRIFKVYRDIFMGRVIKDDELPVVIEISD